MNKPINNWPKWSRNHIHAVWLISLINMIVILINNWLANEPANQAWEHTDMNKLSTMQAYSWSSATHSYCMKLFMCFCCCVKANGDLSVSRWKVYFWILHAAITLDCNWSYDMTNHDSSWGGRLYKCQNRRVNPYESLYRGDRMRSSREEAAQSYHQVIWK